MHRCQRTALLQTRIPQNVPWKTVSVRRPPICMPERPLLTGLGAAYHSAPRRMLNASLNMAVARSDGL